MALESLVQHVYKVLPLIYAGRSLFVPVAVRTKHFVSSVEATSVEVFAVFVPPVGGPYCKLQ